MDSYKKGINLEKLIASIFKNMGYDTHHNVTIKGRSGVEHQIDVLAEFKAPLHRCKIAIECKAWDDPISKDVVMKLIHEIQDIGFEKGIIVTTSYFTPDAISIAEGYNIDLWDTTKLNNLLKNLKIEEANIEEENVFYIDPIIPIEDALITVEKSIKGIFRRKKEIESSFLVYYPYYQVQLVASLYKKKGLLKKKWEKKITEGNVLVDAMTGHICTCDFKRGIKYLVYVPKLSEEEEQCLKILDESDKTISAIAALLNCSTNKARKIVQGLMAKRLVTMYKVKQQHFYKRAIKIPKLSSIIVIPSELFQKEKLKDHLMLAPNVFISDLESTFNFLWDGKVKNYDSVYYPYLAVQIKEERNTFIKAVDLMLNTINEVVGKTLTNQDFFALTTKKIKNET